MLFRSAAIRSDRGGGTVNVTGGSYTTDGIKAQDANDDSETAQETDGE